VIEQSTGASPATVAVALAYPLCDLLLLSFVVGMLTLTTWHPGRALMFMAGGLAANACADGIFLYLEATSGYNEGAPVDSLWLFGFVLVAIAAWCSPRKAKPFNLKGLSLVLVPSTFGALALIILTWGRSGY
jgi:hypothetical protein